MASKSQFLPIVTVDDDGVIEVEFGDSFDHTFDTETFDLVDPVEAHADRLDAVLGLGTEFSTADRLRRLADAIEAQHGVEQ